MAGKQSEDTEQVSTRVSRDAWEILRIGLLVEKTNMQDLLRPVVEDYAQKLGKEPEVQAIIDEVANYQARKQGVKALPKRARGKR